MTHPTMEWRGSIPGVLHLLDQTKLPSDIVYLELQEPPPLYDAIQRLSVRGAPAIGIAAAYGVVLGAQQKQGGSPQEILSAVDEVCEYLAKSRPTAVNLFWALDRMKRWAHSQTDLDSQALLQALLDEAKRVHEEDRDMCRRIGRHAQAFINSGDASLTHCNAGGLATAEFGTALSGFFEAAQQGKAIRVFADETRPLLQGARLTAWELHQAGIDVTLICDNMAGQVMKEGKIQSVFVGSDRIAANGDVANKIGTYMVSVLAKEHGIPFYVAAPTSTIDLKTKTGAEIPIEQRNPDEVTAPFGKPSAPEGINVYNPAFDVTPASNVKAIITEFGVIENPTAEKMRAHIAENIPDHQDL